MAYGRDLGDGYSLTLRDLTTVRPVHELVLANLDRHGRRQRARPCLAERLGCVHEGTLRSGMPLGERRVDVAVYGLVF
ncbi:hypothetical protein MT346_00850 [Curtobacterium sp. VKM Ac-2922]|nr:hypothetical protein [Curtobacterium sp. VKM Ac-2922]